MGRRLGLFVGINNYQDSAFRPLQYAETDAKAFAQWLIDGRGGNWNPNDVHVAMGMEVTKEWLEAQLMQLCVRVAAPGDLIFIYFAGHAYIDEGSGEGCLAASNTLYQQPASAIHLASLVHQALVNSRASQIVLMLDCFQTGLAWNRRRISPFDFQPLIGPAIQQDLQQNQGRILYCACRGNDLAPEVGEKGLGAMLYRTIVGLSGATKDPLTEQATLQQLHSSIISRPGVQYHPQIFGQDVRPITLVGGMSDIAPSAPTGQNAYERSSYPAMRTAAASSTGQITYQGVGESGPLAGLSSQRPGAAATDQLSPVGSTSGQLSLAVLEQNRQQQCMKLVQQARQSLQMQNIPEALELIDRVLQMNPTYGDALTLKGQILGSTGRFQEALLTVQQLLQAEPNNALAWSMQAALLTNTGRPLEAQSAIERSIALNPQNPESLAIRDSIQASLSRVPDHAMQRSPAAAPAQRQPVRDNAKSFLLSAALQILALLIGIAGAALLVLQPHLPIIIGFLLESFGLAMLCIFAARGAFLYGIGRLLFSMVLCLVAAGLLGGIYKFGYNWLVTKVSANPPLIVPVLFMAFWLIASVTAPLLAGLGGFIGGVAFGVRKNSNQDSPYPPRNGFSSAPRRR